MAERGRVWSDNEIAALLAVWGEDSIQRQLFGSVRNVVPYRAIAEALRRQGYDRDFKQYREKIKGLKKKYKETVDSLRRSGVGVESDEDVDDLDLLVSFKWFAEIHSVLGRRAVVSPPSLIDSSNFSSQHSGTSTPAVDAEQSSSTDQVVSLRPANAGEVVQLGTPANTGEVVQLGHLQQLKARTSSGQGLLPLISLILIPPQLYQLNKLPLARLGQQCLPQTMIIKQDLPHLQLSPRLPHLALKNEN